MMKSLFFASFFGTPLVLHSVVVLLLIRVESSYGLSTSTFNTPNIPGSNLPPLVPLDDLNALRQHHFFSATSNWVIPGKVMQGRNPNSGRGSSTERVRALRQEGNVCTFVCLQAEIEPQQLDGVVSTGADSSSSSTSSIVMGGSQDYKTNPMPGFTSYAQDALNVQPTVPPKFVHFGIRDFQPAESLDELETLIMHLKDRVLSSDENDVLYLHCWGGKGRAGLVAACLLGALYNDVATQRMDAEEALQRIQTYCGIRNQGMGVEIKSPETEGQKQQVRDFFKLKLMV